MPRPDLIRIPQWSSTIKTSYRPRRRMSSATLTVTAPRRSRNPTMLSTLVNRPQLPPGIRICDSYVHFFHTFL